MIIHHVPQGTDEWHALRAGIPTASCFDRILTPTGKPSSQAAGYRALLLAEWLLGTSRLDTFESQAMLRGRHLEDEAVSYYEMLTDRTTDPGGLCTTDDGRIGCSPDRLVYVTGEHDRPVGGLEIKCPGAGVHMDYLLNSTHAEKTYRHQVQGCMWVCGLEWWDILSYYPGLPPALVRVEADPEWVAAFAPLVREFLAAFDDDRARLLEMGYTPAGGKP